MVVDEYSFGHITIDGTAYTQDVVILPEAVRSPWWREEGHELRPADLDAVLESAVDTLVIGTGYYGRMAVPEATRKALKDGGIEPLVARTERATAELNRLADTGACLAGAFHLTC